MRQGRVGLPMEKQELVTYIANGQCVPQSVAPEVCRPWPPINWTTLCYDHIEFGD